MRLHLLLLSKYSISRGDESLAEYKIFIICENQANIFVIDEHVEIKFLNNVCNLLLIQYIYSVTVIMKQIKAYTVKN